MASGSGRHDTNGIMRQFKREANKSTSGAKNNSVNELKTCAASIHSVLNLIHVNSYLLLNFARQECARQKAKSSSPYTKAKLYERDYATRVNDMSQNG